MNNWRLLFALVGIFIGLFMGQLLSNMYEARKHNVTLYDAIFVESWRESDQ